jgi:hypothetical protein
VTSKLASRRHNPAGGVWLSAGLLLALLLVWPAAGQLGRAAGRASPPRRSMAALRAGLAGAALLAVEGLFALNLSGVWRKGHDAPPAQYRVPLPNGFGTFCPPGTN